MYKLMVYLCHICQECWGIIALDLVSLSVCKRVKVFDFLPLYQRAFGSSKFRDEDDFKLASEKSKIRRLTQKWHLYV
jgi:hypothetical protein